MHFRPTEGARLFDQYLMVKFDVFVEEMRWTKIPHSVANRRAQADEFDAKSEFYGIVNQISSLVGVVRGTLPPRLAEMYRAELYTDFSRLDFVCALDGRIATMNALAVQKKYRGRIFITGEEGNAPKKRNVLAGALLEHMAIRLHQMGAEAILVSAIAGSSAHLLKNMGFKAIAPPRTLSSGAYSSDADAPNLEVFDMALVAADFCCSRSAESDRAGRNDRRVLRALNDLREYLVQADRIHWPWS